MKSRIRLSMSVRAVGIMDSGAQRGAAAGGTHRNAAREMVSSNRRRHPSKSLKGVREARKRSLFAEQNEQVDQALQEALGRPGDVPAQPGEHPRDQLGGRNARQILPVQPLELGLVEDRALLLHALDGELADDLVPAHQLALVARIPAEQREEVE